MYAIYLIIVWLFTVSLQRTQCLDIRFDFEIQLKMAAQIRQAKSKTISSMEQVFVYYTNNTIARYTNTLSLISSFSLEGLSSQTVNISLDTFEIHNGSIPCYYGIISGRKEILIIQMSNTSSVKRIQGYNQLKFIDVLSLASMWVPELLIFDGNKIWKDIGGVKVNVKTIPNVISQTNTISKVFLVQKNGTKYYLVITVYSEIYFLSASLQNNTYQISTLTLLRKLNQVIVFSLIDRGSILWVQFPSGQLLAFDFFTNITKTIDVGISSRITTEVMKVFEPQILVDGERILFFDSKAIKMNLTLDNYTFISDVQFFNVTNWTGLVILSSNSSFVYTNNSDIINGFMSSNFPFNSSSLCGLSDLCRLSNCLIYSGIGLTCSQCESGFTAFNQMCYPTRNCTQLSNCRVCHYLELNNCLQCETNYTLNSYNNTCYLPVIPSTNQTNQTNITNRTNNNQQINDTKQTNDTNIANTTNQTNVNGTNQTTGNDSLISDKMESVLKNQKQLIKKAIPEELPIDIKQFLIKFRMAASKINGFPGSRIILTFLAPFFGLLDDYWYYLYHQDYYQQLKYLPCFLAYMYTVSKERILIEQLSFSDRFIEAQSNIFQSNFTNYTPRTILQIDEQETFLLMNFSDLYQQITYTLIGFAILKIIAKCIKFLIRKKLENFSRKLNNKVSHYNEKASPSNEEKQQFSEEQKPKHSIFIRIVHFIDKATNFQTFMLAVVGQNLIFLAFTFSSQLKIFFSYTFSDQTNLFASVVVGFIMLTFTCIIFLQSDTYMGKGPGKTLQDQKNQKYLIKERQYRRISHQEREQKQELMFVTYFAHIKCILNGLIHGYLIYSPSQQYVLLISVKMLMIYLVTSKSSLIKHKYQRITMILYFCAGIVVDSVCYLSKNSLIPSKFQVKIIWEFNTIDIIQIASLGLVGLTIIIEIIMGIFESIKQRCQDSNDRPNTAHSSEVQTGYTNDSPFGQKQQNQLNYQIKVHPHRNPSKILLSKPIFRQKISLVKESIEILRDGNLDTNDQKQKQSKISAENGGRSFSLRNQLNIQMMKKYKNSKNVRVSRFKDTFQVNFKRQISQIQDIFQQQSVKQDDLD